MPKGLESSRQVLVWDPRPACHVEYRKQPANILTILLIHVRSPLSLTSPGALPTIPLIPHSPLQGAFECPQRSFSPGFSRIVKPDATLEKISGGHIFHRRSRVEQQGTVLRVDRYHRQQDLEVDAGKGVGDYHASLGQSRRDVLRPPGAAVGSRLEQPHRVAVGA